VPPAWLFTTTTPCPLLIKKGTQPANSPPLRGGGKGVVSARGLSIPKYDRTLAPRADRIFFPARELRDR